MKHFLILILFLFVACNNEQGFTNKAEAKNELVNGVKEGKWVEYLVPCPDGMMITNDTTMYFFCKLTFYKTGKPQGIVREYYKNGKLFSATAYTNGKAGVSIFYDENGKAIK
jgi:antitoxin component YwqK of YwqJK toxin-antitoxin module